MLSLGSEQVERLTSLQPLATVPVPPGLEGVPRSYLFTPDGRTLLTGYYGGATATALVSARTLDVATLLQQACSLAGTPITADEWRRAVGDDPPEQPAC